MTVAATRRASRISRGIGVGERARLRRSPAVRRRALDVAAPSARPFDYPMRAFSLPITLGDGLAFGARGEGQRHAVLEHRLGQLEHVVDRRREAAVEQRAGAHRQHQRLAGARARAPGDQLADVAGLRARDAPSAPASRIASTTDSPTGRRRTSRCAAIRSSAVIAALASRLFGAGGVEQDFALGVAVGIVDVDLHQEAVELRFGQRIGAFLLERVLRRQHVERLAAGRGGRRRR